MRRTTKIIIGIILSIFLLSLLHIIGYSFTDRKNYKGTYRYKTIQIPQTEKSTGINIAAYNVIKLELSDSIFYFPYDENGLFIYPATTTNEENRLFIPEALYDCISTQSNNDTLSIKIKMDEIREKYDTMDKEKAKVILSTGSSRPVSGVNLILHTSNVNIISQLYGLHIQIRNIEADSIKIHNVYGNITIDSCKAKAVEPHSNHPVSISNCSIQTMKIDLDQLTNLNIDGDNDVDTYYFTGGKQSNDITTKGPDKKIVWQPKNNEAELNFKIKTNTGPFNFEMQTNDLPADGH